MSNEVQENVIEGGLLVYCSSVTEASKLASLKNKAGGPAIEFYKDGKYQSVADAESIKQVKISHDGKEHYFRQIAVASGDSASSFAASAWVEIDAEGKLVDGKTTLKLCYNGYTGSLPPSSSDPKAASALAVMHGEMNPQNKEVSEFVKKALAAAAEEGEITDIDNYGHSVGASNAMLSNAIVDASYPDKSQAILVEPFKADKSIKAMVTNQAQLNLPITISSTSLVKHTASRMAARRGSDGKLSRLPMAAMFLGDGVGEDQALVDMGPDNGGGIAQAVKDHAAAMVANAQDGGAPTEKAAPSANSNNNIESWIMGILMNFLQGLFGIQPVKQQEQPKPAVVTTSTKIATADVSSLGASGVTVTDPDAPTKLPTSVKPSNTQVAVSGPK